MHAYDSGKLNRATYHCYILGNEHPAVQKASTTLQAIPAQNDIPRALVFSRGNNIEEHNLAVLLTTGSEAQKRAYIATLSGATRRNYLSARPSKPH